MTDGHTEALEQQAADAKRVVYSKERWIARLAQLQREAEQAADSGDHDALHIATIERLAVQRAMRDVFGPEAGETR